MWAFPMVNQGAMPTAFGLPGYAGQYSPYGYPSPGGYPPTGGVLPTPGEKRKRKKKDALEMGAPKKPATSFVMFSNVQREQVKIDTPGLSFTEMGRKLGEMWRELDPPAKKEWEGKAMMAKDAYLEEKKAWTEQRSGGGGGGASAGPAAPAAPQAGAAMVGVAAPSVLQPPPYVAEPPMVAFTPAPAPP
ncbi:high mobility group box domain-containing protein [Baffinella frigidus]|nr:high mobility group box domain-containing protein [Cryptophyta sp. CCMP2293]